jgi:hypothetical protein
MEERMMKQLQIEDPHRFIKCRPLQGHHVMNPMVQVLQI